MRFVWTMFVVFSLTILSGCELKGIDPPLLLSARHSMVGKGIVFVVTNKSDHVIHGVSGLISSTRGKRSFSIHTIHAHGSVEIGWLQLNGWIPPVGSSIEVKTSGYLLSIGPHVFSGG